MPTIDEIEQVLPQTQCGECEYPGCRPYARAIAQGITPIDRCTPGGVPVLNTLAALTKQDARTLLPDMQARAKPPMLAIIDEAKCIGCTKCIKACPVDAIVGSAKAMHWIVDDQCTGCELCVAPCPVDCIEMKTLPEARYDKNEAKARFEAHNARLQSRTQKGRSVYSENAAQKTKQDYIAAAMARTLAKKKPQHECE